MNIFIQQWRNQDFVKEVIEIKGDKSTERIGGGGDFASGASKFFFTPPPTISVHWGMKSKS